MSLKLLFYKTNWLNSWTDYHELKRGLCEPVCTSTVECGVGIGLLRVGIKKKMPLTLVQLDRRSKKLIWNINFN